MDTRLKKTKNWKVLIIALVVMIPALILVCFYPRMEKSMLEMRQTEQEVKEPAPVIAHSKELSSNFVNYAVEASYYMYGLTIQEENKELIDFEVLDSNGWINDYYDVHENTEYYAEYTGGIKAVVTKNTDEDLSVLFENSEEKEIFVKDKFAKNYLAYMVLEYNSYGQIVNVGVYGRDDINLDNYGVYQRAKASVEQYEQNASVYQDPIAAKKVCPADFRVAYLIPESSNFVYSYYVNDVEYYEPIYYFTSNAYINMGVIWIILILAVAVAGMAFVLPLFKKLRTGQEKVFHLPLEVTGVLFMGGLGAAAGMTELMFFTTLSYMTELAGTAGTIPFVGFALTPSMAYRLLLLVNFIGWSLCFLVDYLAAGAFRQFLCSPVEYVKKHFLCGKIFVRICRWLKKKGNQLYRYVTEIDISRPLQKSIVKILVVNLTILMLYSFLIVTHFLGVFSWHDGESILMTGIVLLMLYHLCLYKVMRKQGGKVQKQYHDVWDAAHEMAEGNLKIALKEEELGVMKPIGVELGRVQQGFSKAVAEEAKSQSMKTELITNVSHDLKTPLTAIITYVDLLKKEDITEEERKSYIATLDQKSQRLKVLIEDLFEVSKANSGTISMNFMEVDVVNLMKQVRLEMEDKIAASGLIFRWNLPEDKVILSLDGQRTYRVFENLLNNILKYSMPNSRVYIDILKNEQDVQVVFKNMSAEELNFDSERLTERFVRGDVSRKTEGSGLGLAIVKSFVELQRGKVEVSVDGDLFKVVLVWKR